MAITVHEQLRQQLEYTNVLGWRNKGVTGKGIKVWNGESNSGHGENTRAVIEQVAPNTDIVSAELGFSTKQGVLEDGHIFVWDKGERVTIDDFLINHRPTILSQSMKGSTRSESFINYCKGIVARHNLKILKSAGNEGGGEETLSTRFPPEAAIIVGALNLIKGKVTRASYSSVGEALDFSQFTSWFSGTSFSTPFLAGQTAMIYERYGEMGVEETYLYLKMISDDLGDSGRDTLHGWGQPILPAWEKKYITMTTKDTKYQVDGKEKQMDTKPVNIDGNVFVPIRAVSESLGATVNWNMNADKTIKVVVEKDGNTLVLNTGDRLVLLNGRKVYLNVAPFIDSQNRTLVPIRVIAEGLGCLVDWVQPLAKVMILEK